MSDANRAPKFVVLDKDGLLMYGPSNESFARETALRLDREDAEDAPHSVHLIGPALPGPAPVKGDV